MDLVAGGLVSCMVIIDGGIWERVLGLVDLALWYLVRRHSMS